jgi:hypothetical protein
MSYKFVLANLEAGFPKGERFLDPNSNEDKNKR